MSDRLVLVTGATGQQGGAIAHQLLQAGWLVRAMTRKPDSPAARALASAGAEIVRADLDDEASLWPALQGAWGTVAVQNTWEAGVEREEVQGKRFARVAREAGVQHYVYQSVGSAHRDTGIPHFDNKWRIEETVRSLGFPTHVVLRPVFFMENLLSPQLKAGIEQGVLALGIRPDTRLQMVAVADIGRYGLLAFERYEELNGRGIDLASVELTGPETAQILSEVTGRRVEFQSVPLDEIRKYSEEYAVMLDWFDRVGYNADIAGNAAEFGVPPTSLRAMAASADWTSPQAVAAQTVEV